MGPASFGIRFGDLIGLLSALAPSRAVGVASRLKYLQRRGFPTGVNPGSGGKMRYDLEQVLKVALAFEMLACGIAPAEAAEAVERIWGDARAALVEAWWCREVPGSWDDRPLLRLAAFDGSVARPARALVRASDYAAQVGLAEIAAAAVIVDPLPLARTIARALPLAAGMTLEDLSSAFDELAERAR